MDISVVVSILLGAVITLGVAWFFYRRASKDLAEETAKLRRISSVIATALEEAHLARLVRDEQGEITGLHLERTSSDTATLKVTESSHIEMRPIETTETG